MEEKNVERVIVLIDGSNVYYSTARKGKKIDFEKLVRELVSHRTLIQAYYYVAPLDFETNPEKYWDHQRFLDVLRGIPKFTVELCTLKKIKAKSGSFVFVVKGDDVRLAHDLLMGAVKDLYDTAIIVSGDEDFVPLIKTVKEYGKKVENAYFPASSSSNLRKACNSSTNLNKILHKIVYQKDSENQDDDKADKNINGSALSDDHTEL